MSEILEEEVRAYKCSDGKLAQYGDFVVALLTRDLVALGERGITAAGTITPLQGLITAFRNSPTDANARGVVTDAVEIKDAARDSALTDARTLRTAAQNKLGIGSGKYNRFKFESMDRQPDGDLELELRSMHFVGTNLQSQLESEGITIAFLDGFLAKIEAFRLEIQNARYAEVIRDDMTEDRIKKGNAVYKEIVRVCNIGQDYFSTRSEAKYNDYVIENFLGSDAENIIKTGNVGGNNQVTIPLEGVIMNGFRDLKLTCLATSDEGAVLELAARNAPAAPYDASLTYLIAARGETAENTAGAVGYDDATGTIHIIIYNNTPAQAAFRLEIEQ